MKINDALKNTISLGADKAGASKTGASKTDAANNTPLRAADNKPADNVTLSPMYEKLQALESNMASDKVFDPEKVEAIKSAIVSGQFNVNAEKVADGLIESVKDLLSSKLTK